MLNFIFKTFYFSSATLRRTSARFIAELCGAAAGFKASRISLNNHIQLHTQTTNQLKVDPLYKDTH